ncbi:MAG TPA: UTP--glucose-1-phosphate uridylyltransferase [Gaiellales bacterium]|nr:UTP--glucose-1-phosphate uridylyltransferase [Gaiellales bacterium]
MADQQGSGGGALDGWDDDQLRALGVDPGWLRGLARELLHGDDDVNRVRGQVEPPGEDDVAQLPERDSVEGSRLTALGLDAMRRGELAVVVLAGGMATRMGGVVKALVDAVPGVTFLEARLAERTYWAGQAGASLPMWLMTSHATDEAISDALAGVQDDDVAKFRQHASVRLTPEGELFRDSEGNLSLHATGHGDLPDALRQSGLLDAFIGRGGRVLLIANLDNLGASVDPLLLGWHLDHDDPLSVEVVDKGSERGGIPVRLNGRPVILESFRLPAGFDEAAVTVFNTNTFLVDAIAVRDLDIDWSYFRVEKAVEGRPAIQFERLIGQLPEALPARFLKVPREGAQSRFLPAKDHPELERNRPSIARRITRFLRSRHH